MSLNEHGGRHDAQRINIDTSKQHKRGGGANKRSPWVKGKNRMVTSGLNSGVWRFRLFPQLRESVPDGQRKSPLGSPHAIIHPP